MKGAGKCGKERNPQGGFKETGMKEKWTTRVKIKRISKYVMIICLVFLVILAGFTLYGDKVGNFVVILKEDKVKISACLTKNFNKDLTSRFDVPGIEYLSAATYGELPDSIKEGIGIKNDEKRRYMAFSFYLLNLTDRAIEYDMSVEIVDELAGTKDRNYKPSDALRILVLEERELDGELEGSGALKADGRVFAREESSQEGIDELAKAEYPQDKITYFLDDKLIVNETNIPFALKEVKKYTVVIWLEGYDISCKDELIGGRLKMRMNFSAY